MDIVEKNIRQLCGKILEAAGYELIRASPLNVIYVWGNEYAEYELTCDNHGIHRLVAWNIEIRKEVIFNVPLTGTEQKIKQLLECLLC